MCRALKKLCDPEGRSPVAGGGCVSTGTRAELGQSWVALPEPARPCPPHGQFRTVQLRNHCRPWPSLGRASEAFERVSPHPQPRRGGCAVWPRGCCRPAFPAGRPPPAPPWFPSLSGRGPPCAGLSGPLPATGLSDEEDQKPVRLPLKVPVELQPRSNRAWARVQSLAQNPRLR